MDFLDVFRNRAPFLGGRFAGLELIVRPSAELNGLPAFTHYIVDKSIRVFITEELEDSALRGKPGAQRILGHEFGHVRYHNGAPKAFLAGEHNAIPYIDDLELSAEWQADEAQLSMAAPDVWVAQFRHAALLARECNLIEGDARKAIEIFDITSASRSEHPAYTAFKRENLLNSLQIETDLPAEAQHLWLSLDVAAGKDHVSYRLCPKGFLICKEEFNKMTPCGWRVKNGMVEAYFNMSQ